MANFVPVLESLL